MKKILTFLLAFLFCVLNPVSCFATNEDNEKGSKTIDETAKSSILMCMDTGDIIYENNAYEHCSPASVTKIIGILLLLEALDNGKISLDSEVTASETAVSKGGSQIWLEVGETMTVDELLKAVIVASANDACTALGEFLAGSDSSFVNMMNDRAKELGLKNSNFENCTGLDDTTENHYSCAYDLAVIASEVMKHDIIKDYSTIWLDHLRNGKTELNNTNKLVNKYNGITGLKTGTTSNAGFCLCATAERDGMNLVAVVLGCKTSDERFKSATNLLDYGFANYQLIDPQIDSSQIKPVSVKLGIEKELQPHYDNLEKIMVKKGSGEISYKYEIDDAITAPVSKGEKVGRIIIYSGDKEIKTLILSANKDIDKIDYSYIFKKLLCNI